jgi:predicted metal-dependent phosphoesterase TrpH
MRIDLHTHTTYSDGTDTPSELLVNAKREGLDVVAIVDHDSTLGWDEAEQAALETGVHLVRGTEVSAKHHGISVHLLCYLQDPNHPALVAQNELVRDARVNRAQHMVERLTADFGITWDDVLAQTQEGTTIGRPHIADAIVAAGIVSDRSAAFADILRPGSKYYVPHYAPDALDAIQAMRAAGGVAVFAHPAAFARGRVVPDSVIAEMAEAGLQGLEIHHRDNPHDQRERLTGIARELDLLITGSSDYHGDGKPNRLGENTTNPQVFAAIEELGVTPVVRA